MSGSSYVDDCPNCGKEMNCSSDWKPIDASSGECPHCGLCYYTEVKYMGLEELNAQREEFDMEPLSELPEQKEI